MSIVVKQDLIPRSASNRPGTALKPTYITVHETANKNKGANAEMHAKYIQGADARSRSVSWHVTVDDTQAIQHLPYNERGWHAGSKGNSQSIGIELCVNSDGNFDKTRARGIQLIRSLMKEFNIPLSRVVSHQHWTGKNCPANLLKVWDSFKNELAGAPFVAPTPKPQTGGTQVTAPKVPNKSVAQMASEVVAGQHGNGHDQRRKSLNVTQAVYDQVSAEVNRIFNTGSPAPAKPTPAPKPSKTVAQMAAEVAAGQHGNGHAARQKSLGVNDATYKQVRDAVNAGATAAAPRKSVAQMATEIIRGQHGNGHPARMKSLGLTPAQYEPVRKEVNRRS